MRKIRLDLFRFNSLSKQTKQKVNKRRGGRIYLLVYMTLLPMVARADVVDTLNNFLSYLTGGLGRAVAGLAITGVGFGCFGLGRIPKGYVIAVVIGIGVIFGVQSILGMLTG